MKIINTVQPTQTADETHASVAAFGETYFVDSGGALSATGSRANGIHAVSGPLTAMVLGSISATQWGIYAASWDNLIEVGVGGSVYGEGRGIFVAGSPDDIAFHTLTNFGFIGGKNEGVRLEGYVTTTYNEGTISSQSGTAIVLDGGFAPAGRVGRMSLLNTGMIFGGGLSAKYAIQGMNGNATIVNSGTISGNVVLGSGDDSFDNRDGTLVNGTISLGDGNDRIWSGNGNDGIITGKGADSIDGGEGTDSLSLSSGADNVTVDLREVNSQATGIGQKTILNIEDVGSGNGDDQLTGNSANNQIATGAGNDTLDGWYGDDTLNGGFGTDTALFSGSAGARVDLTKQGEKQNTGYGLDTLFAIENLEGGAGSDWFKGDANANLLSGNGGNDTLAGGLGDDTLDGGAGINTAVFAGQAADSQITNNGDGSFTVTGPDGSDLVKTVRLLEFTDKTVALWNSAPTSLGLSASSVSEAALAGTLIASLSARDADGDSLSYSLAAGSPFRIDGTSLVLAGPLDFETKASHSLTVVARDAYGGEVSQSFTLQVTDAVEFTPFTLTGTAGADRLEGETGNDVLTGLSGADVLLGEVGNDVLAGGAGKDVLTGGAGQDVFVFDSRPNKTTNVDRIEDFKVADDTIHLARSVLTKMAKKGVIKSAEFYQGPKAHDRDDRLIYDKKTGALYYDADGTGAQAQIQIATLSKNLKMTYKDFFVI